MLRTTSFCLVCAFVLSGCSKPPPPPDPKARFQGVTLKVLIMPSDKLQACIEDQRGEWSAQTGGQVEVEQVSVNDVVAPGGSIAGSALAEQSAFTGDILIFPATDMANVVASGYATRVPKEVFGAPQYESMDIALGVQDQIISWDRHAYGVPMSAESLLLYYRVDLLSDPARRQEFQEKFGRPLEPPKTWKAFDELARYFGNQDLDGDGEPDRAVTISSAGEALLCRAAAYGKPPQNLSFFFDVNTLDPLTTSPPFQEALAKWLEIMPYVAVPQASDRSLSSFSAGKTVFAIGSSRLAELWMRPGNAGPQNKIAGRVACAATPGSARVYQHDKLDWADLSPDKLNHVGIIDGTVAAVPKKARYPEAAFDFLTFLTNRERSLPYVTTSAYGLGPYRSSHLVDTAAWAASGWTSSGTASYLSAMRASLNQGNVVAALRIDASGRYHQSLDQAALAAFQREGSSTDVLSTLGADWKRISDERGLDRQRRNYRYSLGMPVLN
jgi:multiple sugar transport system substrate-binding protein